MVKPRVIETTEGIQGEFDVVAYDRMMHRLRDRTCRDRREGRRSAKRRSISVGELALTKIIRRLCRGTWNR